MLKINSYCLLLLSVLFYVNSANVLHGSSRQSYNSSLPSVVNSINSNSVHNPSQNLVPPRIRTYTPHSYDAQSEESLLSSYHHPENSVSVPSLFPVNSVTPQPHDSYFDSSTNTFISQFSLPGWDLNNSTNTSNMNNVSIPIANDSRNFNNSFTNASASTHTNIHNASFGVPRTPMRQVTNYPTATAQSEQGSLSSIHQHTENTNQIRPLFPSVTIASQPSNWPDSSTNTFIPPFLLSNNSTSMFGNINNNNLFMELESANFDNACANTSNSFSLLISDESILSNTMDTSANANNNNLPPAVIQRKQGNTLKPNTTTDTKTKKKTKGKTKILGKKAEALENTTMKVNSKVLKKPRKNNDGSYKCPTCNKHLTSQSGYNYHIKTHDPNRERPYECHLCDKSFVKKSILKGHIKRHNKEKKFSCDFCSKCFITKYEKEIHYRKHTGNKPFKCDYCSKRFIRIHEKIRHERVHTGERPYKCDFEGCNKGFKTSSAKKAHYRTHTGEKPFKCILCSKGFSSKDTRDGHVNKVHTGKKPHKCKRCKKAFYNKDTLRKHNKKFHPEM